MPLLSELASLVQQNALDLEAELAAMNGGAAPDLSLESPEPALIDDPAFIPSVQAFNLMEKLRASISALESAFTPSKEKYALIAMSPLQTKALNIAVELGVSDAIDAAGGEVELTELARRLAVHPNKLGHIMRILACKHIYVERRPGVFANSRHSTSLRHNTVGAKAMLSFLTVEAFEGARMLPDNVINKEHSNDFSPEKAPFVLSTGEGKPFMEYLMGHGDVAQKVVLGVVPWLNAMTRPALIYDYPWQDLNDSTVVDLGCGPGDAGLDLLKVYPKLRWIFQDLPAALEATRPGLEESLAAAGAKDRAQLVAQDYFETNKTLGDVYFLRGVIRDYDDADAVRILTKAAEAMKGRPNTRLLINEIITGPPDRAGQESGSALRHSARTEIANLMALNAFSIFSGMERSWPEVESVLKASGLVVERVLRLRTFTVFIECRVPN